MPTPECEYCGKSEPEVELINFGGIYYCKGWCLETAKENARINSKESEKEQ
jgi:hypothetical protein